MDALRTELIFLLDRSGSMAGLEADTIGGYNALLEKQKHTPGEATVTTVLFDDRYELLHDRVPVRAIVPITEREYFVRGSTALLDAIGRTIRKVENAQKHIAPEYRADTVLFVITTDGMENASQEYTLATVRSLITQKREAGWEFLFLGANIDAAETATRFGMNAKRAATYHADSAGVRLNFTVLSEAISHARASGRVEEDCLAQIRSDFAQREE